MTESFSDSEILTALKSEQPSKQNRVISFLYNKCYPQVLAFVTSNNGTFSDCEDLFQQTMEVFYYQVQRGKFEGKSAVATYIYGIAKNTWLTELRRQKQRPLQTLDRLHMVTEEDVSVELNLPLFQTLFEKLENDCQNILKYFYFERLSMKEIVSKFDSINNEQSVRSKKYRCLKYLSDIFKKSKIDRSQFIQ